MNAPYEILACVFFILLIFPWSSCSAQDKKSAEEKFRVLNKTEWKTVFSDPCTKDWKQSWTLDGENAKITNSEKGMDYYAGPEYRNDAHHAVLWTKKSFEGDIRLDYEYTRLDDSKKGAVTILYLLATGSGKGDYDKDISKWAHLRKVAAMNIYFNNMNTLHISYAAFKFKAKVTAKSPDYVRARRYMPLKGNGLKGTDLKPDYSGTKLFKKGVPHTITVIKKGWDIFMHIQSKDGSMLCRWKNTLDPITEGRIGLRHMYTRSARYRDFRISVAGAVKPVKKQNDEFDRLRLKWKRMIMGADNYDPKDPDVAGRIKALTEEAEKHWKSMNKNADRKFLWPEYEEMNQRAWNYKRLLTMTYAWSTKGSKLEGSKTLLKDIFSALEWLYINRYNERMELQRPGWFHPEIYIPKLLNDITVLLYDELSEERKKKYMTAIERFCPDLYLIWGNKRNAMTGANRAYKARVIAIRGIIVKDPKKLALARDALSNIFGYVTRDDGFYRDGSFIQHHRHPYTGGYGTGLLRDTGYLIHLFDGSSWEVTDPNRKNVYDWVINAYQPIMFRGNAMDMVRGRTIAFYSGSEFGAGSGIILAAGRIAMSAPSDKALAIKRMIKYWIEANTFQPTIKERFISLPDLLMLRSILNDPKVTSRGDLKLCRVFANMDRVVHHRPGFTFAISMHSNRIYNFENIHGHNKCGWYTGDGMTYLYNNDLAQYSEEFWPTVYMQRLPGTTVGRGSKPRHRLLNRSKWVGGVEWEKTFGVTGMHLTPRGQTLSAKKSWFLFDNEIAVLGSGISCRDKRTVETIVENRKLKSDGSNVLTVNGKGIPKKLGWSENMNNVSWIHLAGNVNDSDIGWWFPEPALIKGVRESRTGMWKDISDLGARERVETGNKYTRNFLTLWLDHGKDPKNASYAYVLLPNKSSKEVKQYAGNPDIEIIKQTTRMHAVREKKLGLVGANFWTPGPNTADIITCKGEASVMVGKNKKGELIISAADPTHAGTIVEIEITDKASKIISKDKRIKVVQLSPTIKLSLNVKGAQGRTLTVKLK